MRTFDSDNWFANITKAQTEYGFNPKYNLLTGLKQIYNEQNIREVK